MGYLENANYFSGISQFGIQYLNSVNGEPAMRPTIVGGFQSIASNPEYFINTQDQFSFADQLSTAIESALDEADASAEFTLTEGYVLDELSLFDKKTEKETIIEFTQNGSTITTSEFKLMSSGDYQLNYKVRADGNPRDMDGSISPTLSGSIDIEGIVNDITVDSFGPSSADYNKYLNCQVDIMKEVKTASQDVYSRGPEILKGSREGFTFKVNYSFYNAPYAWTIEPVLFDAIDPRVEVKNIYLTDSNGQVVYDLNSNNMTLNDNNEVRVTLPADSNGSFDSYVNGQYSLFIEGKIADNIIQDKAAYQEVVLNGIPNVGVIITDNPNSPGNTEEYESNEVVVLPPEENPAINLSKEVDSPNYQIGDTRIYTFIATNTGNQSLVNVTIEDPLEGLSNFTYEKIIKADGTEVSDFDSKNIILAPGDQVIATAELVLTEELVNQIADEYGLIPNTAKTQGETEDITNPGNPDPNGETVTDEDSEEIDSTPTPNMSVEKSATSVTNADGEAYDAVAFKAVGDLIYYSFTFTNTGNNDITSITFSDEKLGITDEVIELGSPLTPGATYTHEVTTPYAVTEADLEAGSVLNVVTSTGTTPDGETPPTEDEEEVPELPTPGMSVEKSATSVTNADGEAYDAVAFKAVGDLIYYSFTFTNTGNNDITSITFSDEKLGITDEVIELGSPLTPGATYTHEVTTPYAVTEADLEAGSVLNVVTSTGTTPDGETPPTEDEEEVPGTQEETTTEETTTEETTTEESSTSEEVTTSEEQTTSETTTSIVTVTDTTSTTEESRPELYDASIKKVDQHGNAVKGVTFELYRIVKTIVEDAPVTVEPAAVDTSEVDAAIEALIEQIGNLQNQVAVLESEHGTVIPSESVEPIIETSIVPEVTAEDGTVIEESYVTEMYIDPVTEAPTVIDHSAEIDSLNAQIVQLQQQVNAKLAVKTEMTTESTTTSAPVERIEEIKIGTYETDANGLVQVKDLAEGEYYFVETAAPAGYDFTNEQYHFNLPNDKPVVFTITNFNNNTTTVETETSIVTETTEEQTSEITEEQTSETTDETTSKPTEETTEEQTSETTEEQTSETTEEQTSETTEETTSETTEEPTTSETNTPGGEETTSPGGTTPNKPNKQNTPNNRKHLPNTGESFMNKIVTTTIGIGLLAGGFFVFRSKREHE